MKGESYTTPWIATALYFFAITYGWLSDFYNPNEMAFALTMGIFLLYKLIKEQFFEK